MKPIEITTQDPKKGTVKVGVIEGDSFIKKVVRSRHYLRVVSGYAIQQDVIDKIDRLGVKEIIIQETKTKRFKISLNDFKIKSRAWTHGHGAQRAISEKYLERVS